MCRHVTLFRCLVAFALWPAWAGADVQFIPLAPLSFGNYAVPHGGQLTITPSGIRHATAGVHLLSGGDTGSAQVLVRNTGQQVQKIKIDLPPDAVLSSNAGQIPLTQLLADPHELLLAPGEARSVRIGATLRLASQPPQGQYSAQIPLRLIHIQP